MAVTLIFLWGETTFYIPFGGGGTTFYVPLGGGGLLFIFLWGVGGLLCFYFNKTSVTNYETTAAIVLCKYKQTNIHVLIHSTLFFSWMREGSRLMTTKPSPSPSISVLSYSPSISSEVFKGLVQRIAPDISCSCRHNFFVLIYPSQLVSIRHSCSCLLKGCFGKISLCTGKQHLSLPLVSSCIMKASDLSSEAIICPM